MKSFGCVLALLAACCRPSAAADVVVLANRARQTVSFELAHEQDLPRTATLPRGAARAFALRGETVVRLADRGESRRYELQAGAVYYFHDRSGAGPTELAQIQLRRVERPPIADDERPAETSPAPSAAGAAPDRSFRLQVKILVDDGQRAARQYWEPRLRKRLAAASQVFEQSCGIGFEVVAAEVWRSGRRTEDFEATRDEFERRVDPAPAQLAIGFTSHHLIALGQDHADGFRPPLGKHVLIREGSQFVSEAERLELLVHELGHYLGAVHCPEPNSVMRPLLADRQALARDFPLGFDPLNTLAIAVVADEVRVRGVQNLGMLSATTRRRLRDIYATLLETLPGDLSGEVALGQIADPTPIRADVRPQSDDGDAGERGNVKREGGEGLAAAPVRGEGEGEVGAQEPALVVAARAVLRAVSARARQFQAAISAGSEAPSGAELFTAYVRAAAETAAEQPPDVRAQAFLLALAIGLDRSDALRKYAVMSDLVASIESNAERDRRLAALGAPTFDQRHDLVQHFVLSAAIASSSGAKSAEAVALAKQLHDARYGGGFSFASWCADLAGIAFARRVQSESERLDELARTFRGESVLPSLTGLPERLSMQEFKTRFGSASDERFRKLDEEIRRRIAGLKPPEARGAE